MTAEFGKFAKRQRISNQALQITADQVVAGLSDAKLGNGLFKKRIARRGAGKSGGYRSILVLKDDDKVFFIYGYSKNDLDNVSPSDMELLKSLRDVILNLTDHDLKTLLEKSQLRKLNPDEN